MSVCVCVYVYMYVWVCGYSIRMQWRRNERVYVRMSEGRNAAMHIHICTILATHTHTYRNTHTYTRIPAGCMKGWQRALPVLPLRPSIEQRSQIRPICMHVWTSTRICRWSHVHIHRKLKLCACKQKRAHIHIHIRHKYSCRQSIQKYTHPLTNLCACAHIHMHTRTNVDTLGAMNAMRLWI